MRNIIARQFVSFDDIVRDASDVRNSVILCEEAYKNAVSRGAPAKFICDIREKLCNLTQVQSELVRLIAVITLSVFDTDINDGYNFWISTGMTRRDWMDMELYENYN